MSDLDNEEIEATKKLQEKSADELFEEIGYWKESEWYYRKPRKRLSDLQIRFLRDYKMFVVENGLNFAQGTTMQELKAINKKVSELGWI